MSSLWTPSGERPVGRPEPTPAPETAPAPEPQIGEQMSADDEAIRSQIEQMRAAMLQAPAADVIAEHLMGLYELAALHLSQPAPRLEDAKLAIDAFVTLLAGLEGRLGPAEAQLNQVRPQLQMAYVQAKDRATPAE